MRGSLTAPLGGIALALVAFGCSAPVVAADAVDAEATAQATAVVVVERTSGPGESTRSEAVARFVKTRTGSVDDQALRMVGAAVDFPAMDSCSALGRVGQAHDSLPRAVRLADVGAVSLESNGVRTTLAPRQVPDVSDLVSGVVYTARALPEGSLAGSGAYVLRGAGSANQEIEGFEAPANAPGEPADLLIAGQDAAQLVNIPASALAVDLSWEPGGADDLVYVDVEPNDASRPTVRCLFADSGHASLSTSAWAGLDDGVLSVHRLHRESFRARGLDSGEVRFDFAHATVFSRR